jgi:hypothetical protein
MFDSDWTAPLLESAEELRLLHFVRDELAADLEDLAPSLEQLAGAGDTGPAAIARRCAEQLRLFTELAASLGAGLGQEDRIPLATLLRECLIALAPLAEARQLRIQLQDDRDGLGTVYGHRRWLQRALQSYLARQAQAVPRGALIRLELRQSGAFKLISSHWHVPAPVAEPTVPPPLPLLDNLPLALARTVINTHGGRVRLRKPEAGMAPDAAFGGFAISLPTGGSTSPDQLTICPYGECPVQLQSNRYAADLARALRQRQTDSQE